MRCVVCGVRGATPASRVALARGSFQVPRTRVKHTDTPPKSFEIEITRTLLASSRRTYITMTLTRRNTRFAALVALPALLLALSVTEAFLMSSSRPLRVSTTPRRLPWPRPPRSTRSARRRSMMTTSMGRTTSITADSTALAPEVALDPIISDLRARILDAPDRLESNEESRLHAEATLSTTFEVGCDGNVVGGFEQELQLARALAMDTFVVRKTLDYIRS